MATKSVRDFTHRIRCGQGSNLLIPCTPHQHSPSQLDWSASVLACSHSYTPGRNRGRLRSSRFFQRADKNRRDIVHFPNECSHDSIRPLFIDEVSTGSDSDRVALFLDHYPV